MVLPHTAFGADNSLSTTSLLPPSLPSPSEDEYDGMKNVTWRPGSASRASPSRSTSPLHFWSKKGTDTAGARAGDPDADWFVSEKRSLHDISHVDSISNHLGRMTLSTFPARPGSRAPDGSRDVNDSTCDEKSQASPHSITKEEYEALPLAIQRKYFSATERQRLAVISDEVDRIYDHYDLTSVTLRRRKHRQALSSPESLSTVPRNRKHRDSVFTAASSGSWFVDHPHKVSKADLTREQQVNLVKHLRPSVILDAASEAFWQGLSNDTLRDFEPSVPVVSSRRGSLDSMTSAMAKHEFSNNESIQKSLYDSFRWLDEEESLDLGLFLDDYHANLRNDVPLTDKAKQPSYRRRMSANKLPFGRPPSTIRDWRPMPLQSHPVDRNRLHNNGSSLQRRLSLSLSAMSPAKSSLSDRPSIIDPCATYYQDPEARKKLRAYLASPGKFDEAIQFGFEATDSSAVAQQPVKPRRRPSRLRLRSASNENVRSFLVMDGDEDAQLSEEEGGGEEGEDGDDASSASDPESPRTPQLAGLAPPPGHPAPSRTAMGPKLGSQSPPQRQQQQPQQTNKTVDQKPVPVKTHKAAQSYSHFPNRNTSREMTLKMTLTRPELRADEELIYGWQTQMQAQTPISPQSPLYHGRRSRSVQLSPNDVAMATGFTTMCWAEGKHDNHTRERLITTSSGGVPSAAAGTTADAGPWDAEGAHACSNGGQGGVAADKGVMKMKKFWNKVRRA